MMAELPGCKCSRRLTLAILGFMLLFCVTAMRDALSVAIVCMTDSDVSTSITNTLTNNTLLANSTNLTSLATSVENPGDFTWSTTERSVILAMFFAGYCISTFGGLWLLKHDVIRYYMGGGVLVCSLGAILLPLTLNFEQRLIYPLRLIMGMAYAVVFPGLQSMWGKWAPRGEIAKLSTISSGGRFVGTVFVFSLTGVFCATMEDGWKIIFYVTGGIGLAAFIIWQLLTSHSPSTDPFISDKERNFIISNNSVDYTKKVATPWKKLLTSPPVWGCLAVHMMCDWMDFSLTTTGPTYMDEILHFNIEQNGLLSAVPHFARAIATPLCGQLCNLLVKRRWLSVKAVRILFQSIATLGSSGCLIGLGFVAYDQRALAVVLITLAFSFQAFAESAYQVNEVEIAPRYAGLISGMGNSLSGVAGVLAPIVVGVMTPNKTQEEWRNSFFVVVGLMCGSLIVYLLCMDVNVQPWAKEPEAPGVAYVAKFGTEADKNQDSETSGAKEIAVRKSADQK